jgi:uncharacterized protein
MKNKIQHRGRYISNLEIRAIDPATPNEVYIKGYAALFNSMTLLMSYGDCDYYEVILPGAFDNVLTNDVRCLFDHESEYVLGRGNNTRGAYESGLQTLKYGVDEKGLYYECRLDLTINTHNDLYKLMQRGDITQSSFGFIIGDSKWTEETINGKETCTREIISVSQLFDVSPVTYPAYEDTEAEAMRSSIMDEIKNSKQSEPAPTNNGIDTALVARSKFNILKSKF